MWRCCVWKIGFLCPLVVARGLLCYRSLGPVWRVLGEYGVKIPSLKFRFLGMQPIRVGGQPVIGVFNIQGEFRH